MKRKYARSGEHVRLIVPRRIIRWGYPLGPEDALASMGRSNLALAVRAAMLHVSLQPLDWHRIVETLDTPGPLGRDYVLNRRDITGRIVDALVGEWLQQHHHGGAQCGPIFTGASEYMGSTFQVLHRFSRMEGYREPGCGSEDDYEPAHMVGRCHVVYHLIGVGQTIYPEHGEPLRQPTPGSLWVMGAHCELVKPLASPAASPALEGHQP